MADVIGGVLAIGRLLQAGIRYGYWAKGGDLRCGRARSEMCVGRFGVEEEEEEEEEVVVVVVATVVEEEWGRTSTV